MESTRAIDGTQSDVWNGLKVAWSYQTGGFENTLDVVFEHQKKPKTREKEGEPCSAHIAELNYQRTVKPARNAAKRLIRPVYSSDGTIVLKVPGLAHMEAWAKAAIIGGLISLISVFLPFAHTVEKSTYDGSLDYQCNPSAFISLIGMVKYTGDKDIVSKMPQTPSLGFLLLCLLPIAIILCIFLIRSNHDMQLTALSCGVFGIIYTMQYMLGDLLFFKSTSYKVTPSIGMYLLLCGFVVVVASAAYGLGLSSERR